MKSNHSANNPIDPKIEKMNQWVKERFDQLGRINRWQFLFYIFFLLITIFFLGISLLPTSYKNHYQKDQLNLERRIRKAEIERSDILAGKKQPTTASFKKVLDDNLANLGDYPKIEENYTVTIKDTNEKIVLNQNNIFISDNANILNQAIKDKVYYLNKQLAASTNGTQLEVITINHLPEGETIESYANKLFNQLGIGNKKENNGILYLISVGDRKFHLEVGYGLESLLPDAKVDDIINNRQVVDDFKNDKYSQGVDRVLDKVFPIINSKTALVDAMIANLHDEKQQKQFNYLSAIFISFILCLLSLLFIYKNRTVHRQLIDMYGNFLITIRHLNHSSSQEEKIHQVKQTAFYQLAASGILFLYSVKQLQNAIKRGKIFIQFPSAKKKAFGRILVGDKLYSHKGEILTTAYLISLYNSANWFNKDNNRRGGGGFGGFGGGSSGGGSWGVIWRWFVWWWRCFWRLVTIYRSKFIHHYKVQLK